jgi:glucose/arabinose dehydrogenase
MRRVGSLLVVLAAAAATLASGPSHHATPVAPRTAAKDTAAPTVLLAPLAQLPDVTAITNAGDRRLFVTRQGGQVVIWDGTQILGVPFLDVSSLIVCCNEQGLLSTAFHPDYAVNGFFFVDYTNLTGQTVVARYRVSDQDPNVADPSTAVILLTIDQPYANHNGGQLQFGPDGYLYIGMGDGGSANDPQCHAQSSDSLLGKLLRIDVDQNVDRAPYYGIPPSNPFVTTGPPEAWAYGLRNPWRFSFDRQTGDLYIGDVGQSAWEEIDVQPASSGGGQNYGWKVMEGMSCNSAGSAGCTVPPPPCGDPAYTPPVLVYDHSNNRCAITGGYVYRGGAIPDLHGFYVYGDYCSGEIWAARFQSGAWTTALLPISTSALTTFGEGVDGELYVGTQGMLAQIVPEAPLPPTIIQVAPAAGSTRGDGGVVITGTNFSGATTVLFGDLSAPEVSVQSSQLLVASAPAHPPGVVDVTVTNPGVAPAVKSLAYEYVTVPVLSRPPRIPRVVGRP